MILASSFGKTSLYAGYQFPNSARISSVSHLYFRSYICESSPAPLACSNLRDATGGLWLVGFTCRLHHNPGRTTQVPTAAGSGWGSSKSVSHIQDLLRAIRRASLTLKKSVVFPFSGPLFSTEQQFVNLIKWQWTSSAAGLPLPFTSCRVNAPESSGTGSPSVAPIADKGNTESVLPKHKLTASLS